MSQSLRKAVKSVDRVAASAAARTREQIREALDGERVSFLLDSAGRDRDYGHPPTDLVEIAFLAHHVGDRETCAYVLNEARAHSERHASYMAMRLGQGPGSAGFANRAAAMNGTAYLRMVDELIADPAALEREVRNWPANYPPGGELPRKEVEALEAAAVSVITDGSDDDIRALAGAIGSTLAHPHNPAAAKQYSELDDTAVGNLRRLVAARVACPRPRAEHLIQPGSVVDLIPFARDEFDQFVKKAKAVTSEFYPDSHPWKHRQALRGAGATNNVRRFIVGQLDGAHARETIQIRGVEGDQIGEAVKWMRAVGMNVTVTATQPPHCYRGKVRYEVDAQAVIDQQPVRVVLSSDINLGERRALSAEGDWDAATRAIAGAGLPALTTTGFSDTSHTTMLGNSPELPEASDVPKLTRAALDVGATACEHQSASWQRIGSLQRRICADCGTVMTTRYTTQSPSVRGGQSPSGYVEGVEDYDAFVERALPERRAQALLIGEPVPTVETLKAEPLIHDDGRVGPIEPPALPSTLKNALGRR